MLSLFLSLTLSAQAIEKPTATVQPDGSVRVEVILPVEPSAVNRVLQDPVKCGRFTPDVVGVQVVGQRENCMETVTSTRGPGSTIDYRSLRCQTSTGVRDTLVSSESYDIYRSEWKLEAVEGGTRVILTSHVSLSLPIPDFAVRAAMQQSMPVTMMNLVSALGL